MQIIAIDPGTTKSAFVVFDSGQDKILAIDIVDNYEMLKLLDDYLLSDHLVIEEIKSYGMPMGDSTIRTCVWIGRFIEAWGREQEYTLLPRKTIAAHICGTARAKDTNIRHALISRVSAASRLGGGKVPAIGTKNDPGVYYAVKRDMWSALAIATTYLELKTNK